VDELKKFGAEIRRRHLMPRQITCIYLTKKQVHFRKVVTKFVLYIYLETKLD
jgi:hypothetical protein